jgi:hypothetical protein
MSAPVTGDRGPGTGELRGTPVLHGFFSPPGRPMRPAQSALSQTPVPEGAHQ